MEPPPSSSTVFTLSSPPSTSYQSSDFRLLEISLISARDLFPVSKAMQTYAMTWVHPNKKLSTRVDQQGHTNPTWNDKFVFQVDDEFLLSDKADVTVEIYSTASWFRNVIIGTVRVLISNLITPHHYHSGIRRYVALQIRRPSGSPQGILNMGVSLVDTSIGAVPLFTEISPPRLDSGEEFEEKMKNMNLDQGKIENNEGENKQNIHLWRSLSLDSDDVHNEESLVNSGSAVNGSELCSDVGPSASIVAAEIAEKSRPPVEAPALNVEGSESSILEELTPEEAVAKGLTTNVSGSRKGASSKREEDTKGLRRRHSEGGLFSCFGNAYGFEFTIVCGASNTSPKSGDKTTRKKKPNSKANSA